MINGRKGRARELARIHKRLLADAKAAGVDVTDRAALREFDKAQFNELCARIKRNSGKSVEDWT